MNPAAHSASNFRTIESPDAPTANEHQTPVLASYPVPFFKCVVRRLYVGLFKPRLVKLNSDGAVHFRKSGRLDFPKLWMKLIALGSDKLQRLPRCFVL